MPYGSSWIEQVLLKQGLMCLAQGHNTVMPVRLKPATPGTPDKHSNTVLSSLKPAISFKHGLT